VLFFLGYFTQRMEGGAWWAGAPGSCCSAACWGGRLLLARCCCQHCLALLLLLQQLLQCSSDLGKGGPADSTHLVVNYKQPNKAVTLPGRYGAVSTPPTAYAGSCAAYALHTVTSSSSYALCRPSIYFCCAGMRASNKLMLTLSNAGRRPQPLSGGTAPTCPVARAASRPQPAAYTQREGTAPALLPHHHPAADAAAGWQVQCLCWC
jgi:hypothetical protein